MIADEENELIIPTAVAPPELELNEMLIKTTTVSVGCLRSIDIPKEKIQKRRDHH